MIYKHIYSFYLKNFSTKTILRRIASIKSLYKFLSYKGFLSKNIASLIVSPKAMKKIPNYLSEKEVDELMSLPDLSTLKELCTDLF